MKTIAIVPALIAIFAVSASANETFDVSYSVNNYKHRNKAEIAFRLNLDNLSWYAYTGGQNQMFDNYKNSFAAISNNGGFVPEATIDLGTGLASTNNYKLQNKRAKNEIKNIEQPDRSPIVFNMK